MSEAFTSLGPRLPEALDTPDILVGWSLEHEHRRQPIGFHFGDPNTSPRHGFLDPVLLSGEGHLVTIAPTGAGKGVSAIIPTLLRFGGPIIVIDPKGENVMVTARRRRELGQQVIVIDPMGITGFTSDCLNPLDAIQAFGAGDVDDTAALVSALFAEYVDPRDAFWSNRAQDLIIGVILYVLADEPQEQRHLGRVREIVSALAADTETVAQMLSNSSHPEAQMIGRSIRSPAEQTMGGIVSFALDGLGFLRGGEVLESVASSTFDMAAVTSGEPLSIYLVLPPNKLESHGGLLRLWIGALMSALVRRRGKPPRPTLFMLDEAAQLGTLPQLRQAMTLMRGYGVQTWSFWQDVTQIQRLYAGDWPTMLSNCKVIQAFGANNILAARGIAEVTGFATPFAILDLEPEEMILQIAGDEPVIARKPNYLSDPAFAGQADPNPFYLAQPPELVMRRQPSRWYQRPASTDTASAPDTAELARRLSASLRGRASKVPPAG
ncbi:type IV secretory system conjugative DNA transfer family protein [Bosea sp. BH3]|uniref:type IV secretory system conjugative DNA transfer family protein n=1 Tax=Bosea sp. BH3 TaxID=2871701 RepID=UPI0021CB20D4|nr:type IV secretory system conjugative DNA transfer family protein [Bosea sp. BH3]MCU4180416.1 type IV secretory system conjugative DNA transfer family protein [Bosea sp. BH3]